jgi:hypothetical protein
MARDLVFQGVNVLGQNELKLTYKRLYLKKICRGALHTDNHTREKGWEGRGGEGRRGEGTGEHGRGGKGLCRGRLRHDS